MYEDLINIGLAFIEGFALIISPCILPILPIVLSGSLTGSKARPLGIITGFILTFTVVTLLSRSLLQVAHIDQEVLRNISFSILLLLGVIMMSQTLTEKFSLLTNRLANLGSSFKTLDQREDGFWGGMLFGGLVGIIWTPCAGPILAAVIVQVVLQKSSVNSLFVVLSFAIGVAFPMILIAFLGRDLINHLAFFREKGILFRRLLGLIIILTVIYLLFFSVMSTSLLPLKRTSDKKAMTLINGIALPYQAPAIEGIDAWINSPPLNWQKLKNKVVLLDFWTYSCINCIRALPYLKDWYAKYHDKGFEIIGVHSPEFQFEHNLGNVKSAVSANDIRYPVALDNEFITWQNFQNRYWPSHYLVNKDGMVVYVHYGEGEYDVTENNIRFLLGLDKSTQAKIEEKPPTLQTPETYLGYNRSERFSSPESIRKDQTYIYTYPSQLTENLWALNGKWLIASEKIVSSNQRAGIKIHFLAGKVYAVMGTASSVPVTVTLYLNGKPLINGKGSDVQDSRVQVKQNRLYSVVDLHDQSQGILEMIAEGPGLEMYTFTFGS